MKPILEIENLSKRYLINHENRQPYLSLRDNIAGMFKSKSRKEEFWALRDINFSVNPGESIGIIGKNGAGKSTLLKLLSRITPPTSGRIITRGRIASLLEVGTGFHPELTGRENIFMNGSILGMRRAEILKNFDAIVDFSGVEKFLDTPLKHYSSGMQLRLAFAVAAFLENEILIIDEVLAVGDAEFQKKCMGKMGEVSISGRTVLFVSHNMEAVQTLCNRGILLEKGKIINKGSITDVLSNYQSTTKKPFMIWEEDNRPGDNLVKLDYVKIVDSQDNQLSLVNIGQDFIIKLKIEILEDNVCPSPNFHFFTLNNVYCCVAISNIGMLDKGIYEFFTDVPGNMLNNMTYKIGVALTTLNTGYVHLYEREIVTLEVIEDKSTRMHSFSGEIPGVFRPKLEYRIEKIN